MVVLFIIVVSACGLLGLFVGWCGSTMTVWWDQVGGSVLGVGVTILFFLCFVFWFFLILNQKLHSIATKIQLSYTHFPSAKPSTQTNQPQPNTH